MPFDKIHSEFFFSWHRDDLCSLPFIEFQLCNGDHLRWFPPLAMTEPGTGRTTHFGFRNYNNDGGPPSDLDLRRRVLLRTFSSKRLRVGNLWLQNPVDDEEDEDEKNQLVYGALNSIAPRKALLGKLCLEGQSAQVMTFNEQSRRALIEMIRVRNFPELEYDFSQVLYPL